MIPRLATERLVLRAPKHADFPAYAAFFVSDRSQYEDGPLTRAAAWREFVSATGQWLLLGFGGWSIEDRATGAYLGEVGLFHPAHFPETEIGWTLMADAEGKSIAYEAALTVRAYGYDTVGLNALVSYIDPRNARSIRLAERLGARLDPDAARPEGESCLVYRHPSPEARA